MEEIAIDSTDSDSGKLGGEPDVQETNRVYVKKKCLSDKEWFAQVRSSKIIIFVRVLYSVLVNTNLL